MKITEIVCQIVRIPNVQAKTASSQDSVIVRVRTDTGLEGIGEADSSPEVVKAVIDAPFSHNVACGLRHLAFAVADVEAAARLLEAKGVAVEPVRVDELVGALQRSRREGAGEQGSRGAGG